MKKFITWVQGVIATISKIRKKWKHNVGIAEGKVRVVKGYLDSEDIEKAKEALDDLLGFLGIVKKIL